MNTSEIEKNCEGVEQAAGRRAALLQALSDTFRAMMWQGHKQGAVTMERIGLTSPQAMVMGTIGACGGRTTMSEIAHLTQQSAATITGIVDRLVEARLVARERDEEDRRVVYVRITQAGTEKLNEIHNERSKQLELLTKALTDNELEQLNKILSKLIAAPR